MILYSFQRRSLFGFSRKPQKKPKPIDIDPGLDLMLDLNEMLHMKTRPPPPDELAKAFNDFFQAKLNTARPIEDLQARHAMVTFQHLRDINYAVEGFGLAEEDLRVALGVLGESLALLIRTSSLNKETSRSHSQLAQLLFEELARRRDINRDRQASRVPRSQDLIPFIRVLSHTGDSFVARAIVEHYWQTDLTQSGITPWSMVLRGFAREENSQELEKTIEIMQMHKLPFDFRVHQSINLYYTRIGDMEMTKKWYKHPIANSKKPTTYTNACVLRLCVRKNEFEWGHPIFKSMLDQNPDTLREWNVIFLWAAAQGKGVDEIERMMTVMVRRNEDKEKVLHPDIETINGLVELANSRNDPYTAERYVALGQKWGLQPNSETYILQLDYRIKVGDLDGARAVYSRLQAEEVQDNKDIPFVNKLITAMCGEKSQSFEAIMGVVEDLSERKVRFEPETVAALTRFHLQRGEMHDLVDLLHTHAFHYGLEQRASIRDVILQFCLDRSNSTSMAWDAYSILRQIFTETNIEIRTRLMMEFFDRKRSDMACHVFGHMRQQPAGPGRPTAETYVRCFEGFAKCNDLESLENVHNMLKLDAEVELNTKLYNALMIAYVGCKESHRSLDFWTDIVHSQEGPTYNSIRIALRACEDVAWGEQEARDIWARLKRFEIEITREIYTAYIGALAGQALFTECTKLIDEAEKETGHKPNALMFALSTDPPHRASR